MVRVVWERSLNCEESFQDSDAFESVEAWERWRSLPAQADIYWWDIKEIVS